MKTLADLKRDASKYQWSLIKNSWYDGIPEYQLAFRDVGRVQGSKFSLWTNKDGSLCESWVDFPKASDLTIEAVMAHGICMGYEVTFKRHVGKAEPHTMIYWLRHSEGQA